MQSPAVLVLPMVGRSSGGRQHPAGTHHTLPRAASAEPQIVWSRATGAGAWNAAAVCLTRLALAALLPGGVVAAYRLAAAGGAGARPLPLQPRTAVAGCRDAGTAGAAGFALAVAPRIGRVVTAVGLQERPSPRHIRTDGNIGSKAVAG